MKHKTAADTEDQNDQVVRYSALDVNVDEENDAGKCLKLRFYVRHNVSHTSLSPVLSASAAPPGTSPGREQAPGLPSVSATTAVTPEAFGFMTQQNNRKYHLHLCSQSVTVFIHFLPLIAVRSPG